MRGAHIIAALLFALCCVASAQIGPVPGTLSGGYVGKQPISLRSLGSNTQSGSGHTTTTLTTMAPIHPGDAVLVFYANSDNSLITISGVGDGSSNSYGNVVAVNDGSLANATVWGVANSGFLPTGTVITVTHTSTSASDADVIGAVAIAGLIRASPTDKTNTLASTSASPVVGTTTLSQANEIVVGMSVRTGAYTAAAGFTNIFNVLNAGGPVTMGVDYIVVAATTSVSYAPTWTGGAVVTATLVATFKGFP
jgi:hypothetical protein